MLQLVLFKSLWWYHISIYVWQTAQASCSPFCRDNYKGLSFETFGNTSTQNFLGGHNGHSFPCVVQEWNFSTVLCTRIRGTEDSHSVSYLMKSLVDVRSISDLSGHLVSILLENYICFHSGYSKQKRHFHCAQVTCVNWIRSFACSPRLLDPSKSETERVSYSVVPVHQYDVSIIHPPLLQLLHKLSWADAHS